MISSLSKAKYGNFRKVTAFLRNKGVICYETQIFERAEVSNLPELLLSSDLSWSWESSPPLIDGVNPMSDNLLPPRQLTKLTQETSASLVADLEERTDDGYGRTLLAFGFDMNAPDLMLEQSKLLEAMQQFTSYEKGPLRIVLFRDGDSPVDYAFVSHEPTEQVTKFMAIWGITKDSVNEIRNYDDLHTIKLELLLGFPVSSPS
jgi:hypothetical protein